MIIVNNFRTLESNRIYRYIPETLVYPQAYERWFGRMQALVASKQTLEDFRYVSQIEEIVDTGRRGQKSLYDVAVHFYRCRGHYIAQRAYFVFKVQKLLIDHRAEYAFDFGLLRKCHVNQIESALQTSWYCLSSTARRSHRSHQKYVLDVLDQLFLSIVPEAKVQPEAYEFKWRLGSVRVLCGHVEVVHEVDKLLATDRHIDALRTLFHSCFNYVLHIVGRRLEHTHTQRDLPTIKYNTMTSVDTEHLLVLTCWL